MFWIGLGIGLLLGGIVGIFMTALMAANSYNKDERKREDEEQQRYFSRQTDRNEF